MKVNQFRLVFIQFSVLFFLAACQTAPNIKDAAQLAGTAMGADSSLVFGRILWNENGEEKTIGSGIITFSVSPQLVRLEDRKRIRVETDEKGRFTWALEKGTYIINRIGYRDPWSGNYFIVPKVAFKVAEKNKAYNVGTLNIDFYKKRDLIGGMSGKAKFTVVDSSDNDIAAFREKFPGSSFETQKSLFVHDTRLPQTLETNPEFALALKILQAILLGVQ